MHLDTIIETLKSHGFWFVDVPRTGSTSIRAELGKRFGALHGKQNVLPADEKFATEQVFPDHQTARQMKSLLGSDVWDSLFTFAFIRNPYARIHSMYHYQRKAGYISPAMSFREFVFAYEQGAFQHPSVVYGAHDFVTDENDKLIVSKLMKFETREQDLRSVSEEIGYEFGTTWIQRATKGKPHFLDVYDERMRDVIWHRFNQDFKLGGYDR